MKKLFCTWNSLQWYYKLAQPTSCIHKCLPDVFLVLVTLTDLSIAEIYDMIHRSTITMLVKSFRKLRGWQIVSSLWFVMQGTNELLKWRHLVFGANIPSWHRLLFMYTTPLFDPVSICFEQYGGYWYDSLLAWCWSSDVLHPIVCGTELASGNTSRGSQEHHVRSSTCGTLAHCRSWAYLLLFQHFHHFIAVFIIGLFLQV